MSAGTADRYGDKEKDKEDKEATNQRVLQFLIQKTYLI